MTAEPLPQTHPTSPANLTDQARRLRLAETLVQVSRTVGALETLDEVLSALVEMTTAATGADRGTLFLNDAATGELYSRSLTDRGPREIRILNRHGIAGKVFQTGEALLVNDAYRHPDFNPEVDEQTGYETRNIACVPVRTVRGEVIGAAQVLNKSAGDFDQDDLQLLEAMTTQAALALTSNQVNERTRSRGEQEMEFLDLVAEITSELDLDSLLLRVMAEATRMLNADRSTLFLNDASTQELFARVAQGDDDQDDGVAEIRFPNSVGIAGTTFTTGETINIPHAYADLRFNPSFDLQTGFFTRSILCVPLVNKAGETIGATQVLNKKGGPFTQEDEQRLKAFTAQVSIALENAKLFDDVQRVRNYNNAVLESMSNGVVTFDRDGCVATCNAAAAAILRRSATEMVGMRATDLFGADPLVVDLVESVIDDRDQVSLLDVDLHAGPADDTAMVSVNLTGVPLQIGAVDEGAIVLLEDISSEKRVKSTMARYMDPALADRLVKNDQEILGGRAARATILFSDIRSFTTIAEALGPTETVTMLNEYFTLMVDCIAAEGGMLDKFIGDAIMAAFGVPEPADDDEDRAVRSSISMIRAMLDWNVGRVAAGKPAIDMGIGLNTGQVVTGNIGSPKRMDFTMIGDGVNLASRLEGACKEYKARILISDSTHQRLKGVYRTREVDWVVVKGKTEPVGIHEVLDYHTDDSFPRLMDVVNQFREGIAGYRSGEWDRAIESFERSLAANPADALSAMYIERCQTLRASPPDSWDGVWVMTSK
ncbi:MAG TPA: GAF domain-containing protein [Acidimicrobiales bacterium]|nr:GAF domain-containing protein [Acidimicrobiales bacterium]